MPRLRAMPSTRDKDYLGRLVRLLYPATNQGGEVFREGEILRCRQTWRGTFTLVDPVNTRRRISIVSRRMLELVYLDDSDLTAKES